MVRIRSLAFRVLVLAALVPLGFLIVLYSLQDRMIFPGAATQGTAEAVVSPWTGAELLRLTTPRGDHVAAMFGPALLPDGRLAPDPQSRPALVYFYCNAMCLAYCEPEFQRFRRLGLNVLIPDYLGYGMSGGKASEQGCRETAIACLNALRSRGFATSRVIAGGWSLGGAVAIDLAAREPLCGLIAFSTFTSAQEMARSIIPLPLPGILFRHRFDSLAKLPRITCPILLGHGRRDMLVPFAMFERLSKAVTAPLLTLVLDEAEHNDFYDVGGERIDAAIRRFLDTLPR